MPIKIRRVVSSQWSVVSILFFLTTVYCLLSTVCYAFEPPEYEINAFIDTKNHRIKAKQKVVFTNNSDKEIGEIYFHIWPHRKYSESEKRFLLRYAAYFNINPYPQGFQSGDLKINSVSLDSRALSYQIEGKDETILKVKLAHKILPDSSVSLDLDFTVDIPHAYGRFGWHRSATKIGGSAKKYGGNIISLLRWYPMLSVLDEEGWHNYPFYPYHQAYFSDASLYKVYLTLPKEEVVIHSGVLKDEIHNPDGTKTLFIQSELPLRDFGLVISPDYRLESKEINGIKINSYYLKPDIFYAQKALEFASNLIEYYSNKFIPYPYKEFSIAPSFLGYGGTQSSNLILIDTRAYRLPKFLIRYFDFLIAHETGHQWFYNLVGSDEYKEMFIDEGFNSYFILQYLENKYGKDAQVMVLPKSLGWLIPNFSFLRAQLDRYRFVAKSGLDRPLLGELLSFKEPSSIFSIAYGKGSKVIDMLKFVMGDNAFDRLMQRYFKEFTFKNISLQELERLANNETGRDLNWFFDAWVRKSFSCDYAVKKVKNNRIYLENLGSIQMPVNIRVELENGQILNYTWDDAKKRKEISVDSNVRIKSVQLDPEKRILDLNPVNNYWKRKTDIRPVALYHPLYEIPVFLKDDAYSLVIGPQIQGSDFGIKTSWQIPQDNILYISNVYNFNEERVKFTAGFEQRHIFSKMLKWGIEVFDYNDIQGSADQEGCKLYLRKELWPVSYGLLDENDHITFYLLRNRDSKSSLTLGGLEDVRNVYYRQEDETILGLNLKFGRYGTYPDPSKGWKFNALLENAEHFLGGQIYFWRITPQLTRYFGFSPRQKFALRTKVGLGYPSDKGLFQLGGADGLRGYAYKTINGSQAAMFNAEYRLDLMDDLNLIFLDNLISLKKIQTVGFFDIGKSWFSSFNDRDFKKDVGLGLRFHCDVMGYLERIIFRIDIACALDEPKEDPRIWIGISHTF